MRVFTALAVFAVALVYGQSDTCQHDNECPAGWNTDKFCDYGCYMREGCDRDGGACEGRDGLYSCMWAETDSRRPGRDEGHCAEISVSEHGNGATMTATEYCNMVRELAGQNDLDCTGNVHVNSDVNVDTLRDYYIECYDRPSEYYIWPQQFGSCLRQKITTPTPTTTMETTPPTSTTTVIAVDTTTTTSKTTTTTTTTPCTPNRKKCCVKSKEGKFKAGKFKAKENICILDGKKHKCGVDAQCP